MLALPLLLGLGASTARTQTMDGMRAYSPIKNVDLGGERI